MSNCDIKLFDRVKQKSTSTGTGNFELTSSVAGFKDFSDVYSDQDVLFYCINDATNFEIGSGVFNTGITPYIERNVFYSSASDNSIIDFAVGTKEVFVTYPATHSVNIGSGISNVTIPHKSGIAFWNCNNILDYDSGLVFDKDNKYIGIRNTNPSYAIDVGGDGSDQSMVRASGYYVGPTGIHFPSGNGDEASYVGGVQFQHFEKSQLLGNDTQSVFGLSGVVNQHFYLKQQSAGLFFAGPASGCAPPCSPGYPNFRPITLEDIPYIEEVSGYLQNQISDNNLNLVSLSGLLISSSGYLQSNLNNISQDLSDSSGTLRTDLTTISGIAQDAYDASGTLRADLTSISGTLNSKIDAVSGIAQESANSGALLKTELLAISGIAQSGFDTSISTDISTVDGRLTLQSNMPVTNTDQAAKSTLYFTPYNGNQISLYNGTSWSKTPFSELNLSLSGYVPNSNFDIFACYNSGTLILDSTIWNNDTTRATAVIMQDGVYVKSGDASRRYLGTIRTTATSGQCEDSNDRRFVWNYYNQKTRRLLGIIGGSHTYNSDPIIIRAYDNNTTIGEGRVELVIGIGLQPVNVSVENQNKYMAVGLNFNGYISDIQNAAVSDGTNTNFGIRAGSSSLVFLGAGYNYIQAVEANVASGVSGTSYSLRHISFLDC